MPCRSAVDRQPNAGGRTKQANSGRESRFSAPPNRRVRGDVVSMPGRWILYRLPELVGRQDGAEYNGPLPT